MTVLEQHPLAANHHAGGLLSMSTRPHAQMKVGTRHIELLQKRAVQRVVVVLAGMKQRDLQPRAPQRMQHRRDLDEVWARPDDDKQPVHPAVPSSPATQWSNHTERFRMFHSWKDRSALPLRCRRRI